MYTIQWWKDKAQTALQVAVGALLSSGLGTATDLTGIDWQKDAGIAAAAFLLSILGSIANYSRKATNAQAKADKAAAA